MSVRSELPWVHVVQRSSLCSTVVEPPRDISDWRWMRPLVDDAVRAPSCVCAQYLNKQQPVH